MAYRFHREESVPENVRRIVSEEIASATELLDREGPAQRDSSVHEARKSVKKTRGVLRLLRPGLGKLYKRENKRFRNVGRRLSQIRDAAALLEIFDEVLESRKSALQNAMFPAVRRGLQLEKKDVESRLDVDKVVAAAGRALRSASRHVEHWPIPNGGFRAIAPGFENTYRLGRKALAKVQSDPTPVNYHNFRKRVKDHWYHIRLLESLWSGVMKAHEASLKDLETWLGNDHNLVVLGEKVGARPERFGDAATLELFLSVAGQYQEQLRQNSISLGQRLYARKPKAFVKEVSKLWHTWKSQPEPLPQAAKSVTPARKPQSTFSLKRRTTAA